MEITVSLDVFKGIAKLSQMCNGENLISTLYRLVHNSLDSTWICSFTYLKSAPAATKSPYNEEVLPSVDATDLKFSANFLRPCGFVISNPSEQFLEQRLKEQLKECMAFPGCFYLFVFEPSKGGISSLQKSLTCYKATWQEDSLKTELVPYESIRWVEDNSKEFKKLGLQLLACSHLVQVPVSLKQGVELKAQNLGLKELNDIQSLLADSIVDVLSKRWYCLPTFSIPEDLDIIMTLEDIPPLKSHVDTHQLHLWGFNCSGMCSKHVFIGEDVSGLSPNVMFQVLMQQFICIESDALQGDISEETVGHILGCVHANGLKLIDLLKTDDKLVAMVSPVEYKQTPAVDPKPKPKNSKNAKGSAKKAQAKKENPKIDYIETIVARTNIELLKNGGVVSCTAQLNKQSGALELKLSETIDSPEVVNNLCVSVIFKVVLNSAMQLIPLAGKSILPFSVLAGSYPLSFDCVSQVALPGRGLEFVVNALDLADDKILQSPHLKGPLSPPWMSTKTSTTYLVSGPYLYYHYNQVLKDNDPSHSNLVIGSNKWIGTVESGYFINWYLGFNTKTLYLNQVSDFKNYNGVLAEHFAKTSTPIIIGAGLYAYVLLGICLGPQAEAAYLIADPHYMGEDSIKSIQEKGAVAWKKIDFLAKAASNTFINLCCPQLDIYSP